MKKIINKIYFRLDKIFPEKKKEILLMLVLIPVMYFFTRLSIGGDYELNLEKPSQYEKDLALKLDYKYEDEELSFTGKEDIELGKLALSQKERYKYIQAGANDFMAKFNSQYENFTQISGDLWLPTSYKEIGIDYHIEPENIIRPDASISYSKLMDKLRGGEGLELKVRVDFLEKDLSLSRETSLSLAPNNFTKEYKQKSIKREIREELEKSKELASKEFILPQKIAGGEINWEARKKYLSAFDFIVIYALIVVFLILISRRLEKEKIASQKRKYKRQFSYFIHHIIILIESGKTPYMSLAEASKSIDYEEGDFLNALRACNNKLLNQISFDLALEEIYLPYRLKEIRSFNKYLLLAINKGDEESIGYLTKLKEDMFRARLNQASIIMQKASSNLIFPMILFLLIIIVLTIFPAFYQNF